MLRQTRQHRSGQFVGLHSALDGEVFRMWGACAGRAPRPDLFAFAKWETLAALRMEAFEVASPAAPRSPKDLEALHVPTPRDERALREAERVRELDPEHVEIDEVVSYFMLGRLEEAHRAFVKFEQRAGAAFKPFLEARTRLGPGRLGRCTTGRAGAIHRD